MSAALAIDCIIDYHPPVVSPTTTLLDVVQMLHTDTAPRWKEHSKPATKAKIRRYGYVLVINTGEIKGIVTDRDIVRLTAENIDFANTLIADAMTYPVQSLQVSEIDTLETAIPLIQATGRKYVPILDRCCLMGVVSSPSIEDWIQSTEQRQSEDVSQPTKLAISDQTLRRTYTALQKAIENIAVLDSAGCYLEVNNTYAQCYGYTPVELVGLSWQTTIFAGDIPQIESAYQIMLNTGKSVLEVRGISKQGGVRYQQLTLVVNQNERGEFLGHYCFVQDINERKQAEIKLIEREQRLQEMADSSPALLWIANDQNHRTYFNTEWLKFRGKALLQEVEEGWTIGIHPEDVQVCLAAFTQAFEQRQSVQIEYRLQDHQGEYRWLLDSGRPRYLTNGEFAGYVGSCLDITAFKEVADSLDQANDQLQKNVTHNIDALVCANALLLESESRFHSLADSLPALIWLCDVEQYCTYVNQTWQTFTGRSLEQEMNQGWLATMHPDDKDGFVDQLQTCLATQTSLQSKCRRRDRSGRYRWILNTGMPRYISDQFAGMIGCGLDITELEDNQKALEEAVIELQQSNRDLEEFAYIASHDLREPLRKIRTFAELLLEDYSAQLDDTALRHFKYIINGAERMDVLVQSILEYSRIGRQVKSSEPVDLNAVVQQIADDHSLLMEQDKGWIIYDELPTVKAGKVEIVQLLQNLISNALKFHGEQPPHIQVAAQRQDLKWRISVSDTGIGIAPEFHDRVFTMFARQHSRDQYPGTGIGLSICRKIVESYGGHINFTSNLGEGTTFFFTLPAID